MASILEVTNGTTTLLPTTTWAAPNGLFGATADRNDGSIYGWSDSTATITLPSSGLADGYLFLWGFEFEDASNGRHNPCGRMIQASGTGTFASAQTSGYNRDNSEDRAYVAGWSFVDNPSASSTFTFQWKRDSDTPTGGTVRAFIQAVPLYYADVGVYTSTTAANYGGTTPNQVTGFTGTDGTNITITSNQISVTGDNKRYLCLGSGYLENASGGTRTQRWFGFEIDGVFDHAAKGCAYIRNASNDFGGESFVRLLETVTATRTVELNCYRGDGVAAGQGGADVDGTGTENNAAHAMVVIELNDSAEVYSSTDATGGQEFALTGPVDVDIASTTDIEFNDSASFTRSTDTAVDCAVAMDVFAFANVSHAREASSIGSGSRWTVHGEFTINGTEQTGVGFHGNYNRGNQSSADCHGSSCNQAGVFAVTAGQDIGVSNQELAGTEGGNGDIETQAGWVGFGLINLDTMEESASPIIEEPGTGSLSLTGAIPDAQLTNNVSEEPGAGSLTLTGLVPQAGIGVNPINDPGVASLNLTGYAPSRAAGFRLVGYAPTLDIGAASLEVDPGTGGLVLTGLIPTADATANHFAEPGSGSLSLSGVIPDAQTTANIEEQPGSGALSLTGQVPDANTTANHSIEVPAGSLSLGSDAPTVLVSVTVYPDIGSVAVTGQIPTLDLTANHIRAPPEGGLALSAAAPSIAFDWVVFPANGGLSLTGEIPLPTAADNKQAEPSAGNLSLAGYAPSANISDNQTSDPGTGSLTLTGYISYNYGGPGLRLTGFEPALSQDFAQPTVEPGTGSLGLNGLIPTADTTANIAEEPGAGSLALTGLVPTLDLSDNQESQPGTGSLSLTGYIPTNEFDWLATPGAGSLALTGLAPDATIGGGDRQAEPGTGSLSLTTYLSYSYGGPGLRLIGYEPTLILGGALSQPAAGSLSLTGQIPTKLINEFAQPGSASLALTGYAPEPSISNDVTAAINFTTPLNLTGYAPTPDVTTATASPLAGSLSLTGHIPDVESRSDLTVRPGKGTLTLTTYLEYNYGGPGLRLIGYEPEINNTSPPPIQPDNGILSLETHAPALEITLIPAVFETLILTGYAPFASPTTSNEVHPGTGGLALTGHPPDAQSSDPNTQIPVSDGGLNLQQYAPTLAYSWTVYPGTGAVNLTGYDYTTDIIIPLIELGAGELNLTTYAPTVQQNIEAGELTLTGQPPKLTILGNLPVPTGSLELNSYKPEVNPVRGGSGGGPVRKRKPPRPRQQIISFEGITDKIKVEEPPPEVPEEVEVEAVVEQPDFIQEEIDQALRARELLELQIKAAEDEIKILDLQEELEMQIRLEMLKRDILDAIDFLKQIIAQIEYLKWLKKKREEEEIVAAFIVQYYNQNHIIIP